MTVRKILKFVIKNWTAKLFCFAIAIVVVLFNRITSLDKREIIVSLKVSSNSEFITTEDIPKVVNIEIRGDKAEIDKILSSHLSAYADFSDISESGTYERPIKIERKDSALIYSPEYHVKPNKIKITYEYKKKRKVPLEAVVKGKAAEGFELAGAVVTPGEVTIEGPESIVDKIDKLNTTTVYLEKPSESFSVVAQVENKVPFVQVSNEDVKVSVNIARIVIAKNLTHVPVNIINCPAEFTAVSNVVTGTIKVEVETRKSDSVKATDMKLNVDLSNVKEPGVYMLPLKPVIPKNVTMISFSPDTVEVTVSAMEISPSAPAPTAPQPEAAP